MGLIDSRPRRYLAAGSFQAHVIIMDAQGRMLDVVDPVKVS